MNNKRKRYPFKISLKRIFKALIFLFFFTLQMLFYYELLFGIYNDFDVSWFNYLQTGVTIFSLILVIRLYNKTANISYKLTWSILLLLLPFFGIFVYLLYGNGKALPKRKSKAIRKLFANKIPHFDYETTLKKEDKVAFKLVSGIKNSTGFSAYNDSRIEFFPDTLEKHQRMLEDIKSAKKYIFLEFFIVSTGCLMDELIEILENKGKEGVKIYFHYDDFGSKPGLRSFTLDRIKAIPNIKISAFSPFGYSFNPVTNYRNHRKIVVIDGIIAYTGGDNLADEYIHKITRFGFWRDNSIRIEGQAVKNFILLFLETWFLSSKTLLEVDEFISDDYETYNNESYIQPFGDGPTYKGDPTYSLYSNMISSANEKIYISTPYFIIDKGFINTIVRAIKSGIEVILLVPHIPDKKLIFYMTRGHYGEILKAGGKIYEYSEGFNHAKNMIVDGKYAYIGTSNFDYRSLFLHFECGLFIANDKEILNMEKDFIDAINKSELINYEKWKKRPLWQKFIEFILAFFSPLL